MVFQRGVGQGAATRDCITLTFFEPCYKAFVLDRCIGITFKL